VPASNRVCGYPVSAQNASTSAIAARAAAGDSGLPRANHANATATPELLRANGKSSNGSGAPTRYPPNAAARPINASRVGPSCHDTRHDGRSHPTDTLTCASSDNTVDHALAPSDRFTLTPPDGNEMHRECNGTSWATLGHEREFGPDTDPTDPDLTEPPAPALHSTVRTKGVTKREASASQRAPGHTADQDHRGQNARVQLNLPQV